MINHLIPKATLLMLLGTYVTTSFSMDPHQMRPQLDKIESRGVDLGSLKNKELEDFLKALQGLSLENIQYKTALKLIKDELQSRGRLKQVKKPVSGPFEHERTPYSSGPTTSGQQRGTPEPMKSAPEPTGCAKVPYKDWSSEVKHQEGATCGYHAVWNLAQIMAYLQNNNVNQANQALQKGPPLKKWQQIIGRNTDINDAEVGHLARQVQGLQANDITIIPNIGEWGPFLDENFSQVAERLQTVPGAVHGFLVNTGGHTTTGTGTFGGHWTAIAAQNTDEGIKLHVADSAYNPDTGHFGNQNTIARIFEWLTTPHEILEALTKIPVQLEKAGNILNLRPQDYQEVQEILDQISAVVIATPGLETNTYYKEKIKPQLDNIKQNVEQLRLIY